MCSYSHLSKPLTCGDHVFIVCIIIIGISLIGIISYFGYNPEDYNEKVYEVVFENGKTQRVHAIKCARKAARGSGDNQLIECYDGNLQKGGLFDGRILLSDEPVFFGYVKSIQRIK